MLEWFASQDLISTVKNLLPYVSAGKMAYGVLEKRWSSNKIDDLRAAIAETNKRLAETPHLISSSVEKQVANSFVLFRNELYQSRSTGLLVPTRGIIQISDREQAAFEQAHRGIGNDLNLTIGSDRDLPRGFLDDFDKDPEDFLSHRQPIGAGLPPSRYLQDPTLVPVQFFQGNTAMVGFMKKGYFKAVFGISWEVGKSQFASANVFRDPYRDVSMRRNEICYCGTGMRFKQCHGSLVS